MGSPLLRSLIIVFFSVTTALCEAPPITIGVILPLSGAAANLGETSRKGIELGLEKLSPEDRSRVKLVIEDDGLVNARSVSAIRKLIDVDKVDMVITWSSGTALSVVGITEARKIPHLAIASDPAVALGRRYAFTMWPIPEDEARTLYDYLEKEGVKRVAIACLIHNGVGAVRDAFARLVHERKTIEIVATEDADGTTTDFRAMLARMKRKEPLDAFLPIFFPGQLAIIVKQAREVGIAAPLFGFETFEDKEEIKAANGLFSGVIYSTGADPKKEFIDAFSARYPGESYYTANQAYDALHLLVEASRERKDPDTVVSFLKSLKNYPTQSGFITSNGDNRFNFPTGLKRIDQKGEPLSLK